MVMAWDWKYMQPSKGLRPTWKTLRQKTQFARYSKIGSFLVKRQLSICLL